MKITKNIIATIMTVLIATSLSAKQVGKTPIERPIQPSIHFPVKESSFAQALRNIRTGMRSDQVLRGNRFTDYFINFVRDSVQGSEYADAFAKALLEAGAYLHVTFTGDNATDRTIITDINDEIDRQMKLLFPKAMPIIGKLVEQPRQAQVTMHVVPTDVNTLRKFNVCPLFAHADMSKLTQEQQALAKELKQQGYTQDQIAQFITPTVAPHYSVFNEQYRGLSGRVGPAFENREVNVNVPCVVQLGNNRTLMQCKTLDQFELAEKEKLSPAMCGGLSLNNGRLIRDYARTGNVQDFDKMHSIPDAANFLRKLKIGDWINPEVLRNNLVHLQQELGVDGINVSVIGTVSLFDSQLDKKPGFAVFDTQEFDYVQRVKKEINAGLKQDNYIHIMIIGNAELVESLGHYFCFAIIKKGNEIQYVVLDTIPSAYHLQEGSHERDRLMFVIDNIEKGSSSINVVNLNVKFVEKRF
jgi:hypothetical protein